VTTSSNDKDLLKPHVLVVDDEPEICRMVSLCLQKTGYDVSSVDSADAAYGMLEINSYDAIVADVIMPGQDGIAFLGRVHRTWPEIPVILMTGFAQLQMAVNAIKNGAFDFIHKPFDFDHLRKIVDRAINYTKLKRIEKNYREELEQTVSIRTRELRNAMIELDHLRAELLKAATAKSNFMANISHEMRTPMNGVIGSLELLSEGGLVGAQAEYLEMARQSANNMLEMVNQLLTFNSISCRSTTVSARYDLIDLKTLLENCIAKANSSFARRGLYLKLQIADDVPGQIWTDREHLSRLLEILIDNALKFTEKGGAVLDVTRSKPSNAPSILMFSLTDSGIGIPEEMLERIFEPFAQVDESLTRRHEGVGLGLSIAKQYAQHLNGNLLVEHAPGGGSRFMVTLEIIDP